MNDTFNLCKEVYKRFPEWKDGLEKDYQLQKDNTVLKAPLYTSDYILEKLPHGIKGNYINIFNAGPRSWYGLYGRTTTAKETGLYGESDTPLKALLKLVIALDDAGIKL